MTENKIIKNVDFSTQKLDEEYYKCVFQNCNFREMLIPKITFEQCEFLSCNFSLCKMNHTMWNNAYFEACKMTGVVFDDSNPFAFAVDFAECALQYASFQHLNMQKTCFRGSSLVEADFTQANLKQADFSGCDLKGAIFSKTNLEEADLSTALDFYINPTDNLVYKAKVSLIGLTGLTAVFGVKVTGI